MERMWRDSFEVERFKEQGIRIKEQRLKSTSQFSIFILYSLFFTLLMRYQNIIRGIRIKKQGWKYSHCYTVFILCSFFFTLLTACQNKSISNNNHVPETKYTCAMHPQIMEDKPGSCPICNMDLVPVHPHAVKMEVDAALSDLIEPTNEVVTGNVKTISVRQSTLKDTIHANGMVNYNSNNLKIISSRVSGRIEKLFVKFNFEKVYKGQKIMEIYSPDLAAAQQELLYLKSNNDVALLEQAKTKLSLLGVSNQQLNQILLSGKVNYSIPVYSDYSGYLLDASSATPNQNPENPTALNTVNNAIAIVEGQYVKTGEMLFKLFNDSEVWAEFHIDAYQMPLIHKGDAVKILKGNDEQNAKVSLIQPYFSNGQNYGVLRIYLNNAKKSFKIGELLKLEIPLPEENGLWVPAAAVYQLGNKDIVFLKRNNVLKPKEVMVAQKSTANYLIKSGLKAGDEIAENAGYLIDTQSFIKVN